MREKDFGVQGYEGSEQSGLRRLCCRFRFTFPNIRLLVWVERLDHLNGSLHGFLSCRRIEALFLPKRRV